MPQEQDDSARTLVHPQIPWWTALKNQAVCLATKNAGILLVIASQFFFASMNLSVKVLQKMDPPTPIFELITLRMTLTLCFCMIFMVASRTPDPILGPKGVRGLLFIRGIAGFFGVFGLYYSLNYLSLADATVITFMNPFTVALAGHLILGEAYTTKEALAAVCGLFGVVLIARPPFLFGNTVEGTSHDGVTSFERLRAVGSALIGVCGNTGVYISMRAIGSRAHPMHIMNSFSIWTIIVVSVIKAITRESTVFPMRWQWIVLLFLIVGLSIAAQAFLSMGLRYETATRSSLCYYARLFFVFILQLVVFGTVPSLLSTAGAAIIFASQAFAILSKQKSANRSSAAPSLPTLRDAEESLLRSEGGQVGEYGTFAAGAREV